MTNPFKTLAYKFGGLLIKIGWSFIELGERIEFKFYPQGDDWCTVYDLEEGQYEAEGVLEDDPTENPGNDEEAQP